MNRKLVLLIALFSPFASSAEGLYTSASEKLSSILNNLVIVYTNAKDFDWAIRIYRVVEPGECSSPSADCPTETMYVAVSDISGAPDQKLYMLRQSFGWDVTSVQEIQDKKSQGRCIEVSFREKLFDQKHNSWQYATHKLCVTPESSSSE